MNREEMMQQVMVAMAEHESDTGERLSLTDAHMHVIPVQGEVSLAVLFDNGPAWYFPIDDASTQQIH